MSSVQALDWNNPNCSKCHGTFYFEHRMKLGCPSCVYHTGPVGTKEHPCHICNNNGYTISEITPCPDCTSVLFNM